ncbi:WD repeat-containing protein 43 [Neocloeon triangulifer]|uniref:WD repeat-containing protein 43 n=1 Tax=Neocloeon triangulifer TaxID=2078957 RepID=UPI00286EE9F6|nr:WD repeat-containing protein 43 [Neocloeon triangulifer]
MAPHDHASAFSADLQHFALCSGDGKLRVFETKSSKLVQEFVPEGHLNCRIHSLCWISTSSAFPASLPAKKAKKRKVEAEDAAEKNGVLLGLDKGDVLFYDVSRAEVCGKLPSSISSPVTAIATKDNNVFAGTTSSQIIHWQLGKNTETKSWKANPKAPSQITVVLCHPTEDWLISASRTITVWDIQSREVLQEFQGHLSLIRQLLLTPSGEHLASIAEGERNINVWPVGKSKKKKRTQECIAMLVLQDFPVQMDLAVSPKDGSVHLSAVTAEGSLCIFSETLNGKCMTPSKPRMTLQIADSDAPADSAVVLLPIVAAKFPYKSALEIILSYGDSFNLRFERTSNISTKKDIVFLNRKNPRKVASEKKSDARVVGNSSEAQYVTATGSKRPISTKPIHLPIEDRLKNLSVEKVVESEETRIPSGPTTDSLSALLQQGLASNDKGLQKEILLTKDPSVISSTVANLPIEYVPMLVQQLAVLVHWSGWKGETATKWITEILMHHSSLVLGSPQLVALIQPILGLVEVRLAGLQNLMKLKGRLSLLMAQMALRGKVKKMSPQQSHVTSYDIEDDSEDSSEDDNLSIAESDDSDAMEDDDEERCEEVDEDASEGEELDEPTTNGRTRRKGDSSEGSSEEEDMEC